jgi:glyoxylase-like metal-dependent hydrolase (beta-lactamase superfamily II)
LQSLTLGDVEITRVVELEATEHSTLDHIFPSHDPAVVRDNEHWLAPDHWIPQTNGWMTCVHSYLLRSAGRTILIDTGFGNHKERPYFPVGTHLDTDYLDRLAAAGARPEDIDLVVTTHLHVDHVGWNTQLVGREWTPTFPQATYLFARRDIEYWDPLRPGHQPTQPGRLLNQNVFEDSVEPIVRAGMATIWDGESHRIDENLVLEAAPGHTPGSAVIALQSGGDRALFVGDLAHSPLQMVNPDWNSCFDEHPAQARSTRRQLVARAADTTTLMFAPHFIGGQAIEIARDGDNFAFVRWAPFSTE